MATTVDGRDTRWAAHRVTRRRELVEHALRAIRQFGPGVGMDEIAAQAGTSKTVIYRHFGDRAGLYRAVAQAVHTYILEDLTAALQLTDVTDIGRLTADLARNLTDTEVTVVSLWPGIVDTELLRMVPADAEGRRIVTLPGEGAFDLATAETPRFPGRAVVALATDPNRRARTGSAWRVADLAEHYGFTDVDGRIPRND